MVRRLYLAVQGASHPKPRAVSISARQPSISPSAGDVARSARN